MRTVRFCGFGGEGIPTPGPLGYPTPRYPTLPPGYPPGRGIGPEVTYPLPKEHETRDTLPPCEQTDRHL